MEWYCPAVHKNTCEHMLEYMSVKKQITTWRNSAKSQPMVTLSVWGTGPVFWPIVFGPIQAIIRLSLSQSGSQKFLHLLIGLFFVLALVLWALVSYPASQPEILVSLLSPCAIVYTCAEYKLLLCQANSVWIQYVSEQQCCDSIENSFLKILCMTVWSMCGLVVRTSLVSPFPFL